MRIALALALASCGVLGLAFPCAAQTYPAPAEAPRTVSVPKQAAPQRLGPPQTEAVAPAQEKISLPLTLRRSQAAADPVAVEPAPPPHPQPPVSVPEQAYAAPQSAPAYAPPVEQAAPAPQGAFSTPERLLDWVSSYRKHPSLWRVPAAVHAMQDFGLFADEEKRWFCIGFIAGVLGANPKDGPKLVAQMFPLPDKEQEVIIRAIAYSGRPDWRELLEKYSPRMPLRRPLIDDFLQGKRPTLMELPLTDGGSPGIYALWGYYVGTGQYEPVVRIMGALRWSKNKDDAGFSWGKIFSGWGKGASDVDKITTGGTAKWTLASYAERDRDLLDLYRAETTRQPEEIARPLKDVIAAAEIFESEKIRKDQFGAIEDAQKRQMSAEAGMSKGVTAGSLAIAAGCVAATALGQPEIAVPCVIGGALYGGAAKLAH